MQDREREGEGALVQVVEVRAALDIAVRGRERVLNERVVRDLGVVITESVSFIFTCHNPQRLDPVRFRTAWERVGSPGRDLTD